MRFGAATKIIAGGLLVLGSYAYAQDSLKPKQDSAKPTANMDSVQTLKSTLENIVEELSYAFNARFCSNTSSKVTTYWQNGLTERIEWLITYDAFGKHFDVLSSVDYKNGIPYQYTEDGKSEHPKTAIIPEGVYDFLTVFRIKVPEDDFKVDNYNIVVFEKDKLTVKNIRAELKETKPNGNVVIHFYSPENGLGANLKYVIVEYNALKMPVYIEGKKGIKAGISICFSGGLKTSQNVTSTN